jgi:hypothetical protein
MARGSRLARRSLRIGEALLAGKVHAETMKGAANEGLVYYKRRCDVSDETALSPSTPHHLPSL